MRCYVKVVTLLVVFGAALAAGEEATTAVAGQPETLKDETKEESKEGDAKKTTEKRGLFRVTGVHGEQQFAYTEPQPIPGFQLPVPVEPRAVMGGAGVFAKPYPYAQPSYQQAFAVPPPQPAAYPFSSPMLLLMMPPQPGNPYPTFLMVPAGNILPQYTAPNHILPYQQPRVQFVPQYVPVKSYQSNYPAPAAHFKGDYPQKQVQYQYQEQPKYQYQEQPSASSEEESATPPPSYQTPPPAYSSASVHRPVEYKG